MQGIRESADSNRSRRGGRAVERRVPREVKLLIAAESELGRCGRK